MNNELEKEVFKALKKELTRLYALGEIERQKRPDGEWEYFMTEEQILKFLGE